MIIRKWQKNKKKHILYVSLQLATKTLLKWLVFIVFVLINRSFLTNTCDLGLRIEEIMKHSKEQRQKERKKRKKHRNIDLQEHDNKQNVSKIFYIRAVSCLPKRVEVLLGFEIRTNLKISQLNLYIFLYYRYKF